MSREWKPGDVALIEVGCEANRHVALRVGWTYGPSGKWVADDPAVVTVVRPLVVIDPEDREQIERLWKAWRDFAPDHKLAQDNLTAALREFADPTPPKPDEPTGLGAVVEDADGTRWTRVEFGTTETRNPWYPTGPDEQPAEFADIAAVRVLSEGVAADV